MESVKSKPHTRSTPDSAPPSYYDVLEHAPPPPNHRVNGGAADEDLIAQIVQAGISESWARISLRRCGNVRDAIDFCIESGALEDQQIDTAPIPVNRAHLHKKKKKKNSLLSRTFGGFMASKQSGPSLHRVVDDMSTASSTPTETGGPTTMGQNELPPSYEDLAVTESSAVSQSACGSAPLFDTRSVSNVSVLSPVRSTSSSLSPSLSQSEDAYSAPIAHSPVESHKEPPPCYDDSTVSSTASDFPIEESGGEIVIKSNSSNSAEALPSYEESHADVTINVVDSEPRVVEEGHDYIERGEKTTDDDDNFETGDAYGDSTQLSEMDCCEDECPDTAEMLSNDQTEARLSPVGDGAGTLLPSRSADQEQLVATVVTAESVVENEVLVAGRELHVSYSTATDEEGLVIDDIRLEDEQYDYTSDNEKSRSCSAATIMSSDDDPSTRASSIRVVSTSTLNLSISEVSENEDEDDQSSVAADEDDQSSVAADEDDQSSVASSAMLSQSTKNNSADLRTLITQDSTDSLTLHMEALECSAQKKAAGVGVTVDSAGTITPAVSRLTAGNVIRAHSSGSAESDRVWSAPPAVAEGEISRTSSRDVMPPEVCAGQTTEIANALTTEGREVAARNMSPYMMSSSVVRSPPPVQETTSLDSAADPTTTAVASATITEPSAAAAAAVTDENFVGTKSANVGGSHSPLSISVPGPAPGVADNPETAVMSSHLTARASAPSATATHPTGSASVSAPAPATMTARASAPSATATHPTGSASVSAPAPATMTARASAPSATATHPTGSASVSAPAPATMTARASAPSASATHPTGSASVSAPAPILSRSSTSVAASAQPARSDSATVVTPASSPSAAVASDRAAVSGPSSVRGIAVARDNSQEQPAQQLPVGVVTALAAQDGYLSSRGSMRPESIARLPQANVVLNDDMDDDTVHGEAYVALGSDSSALSSSSSVSGLYLRDERGGVYVAVAAPLPALDDSSSTSGTDQSGRNDDDPEHAERRRGLFSYARHRLYGDEQTRRRLGEISGGVKRRVFLPFDINERDGKFFPSVHLRQPKLGPNMGPQTNRPPVLNLAPSSSRALAIRHAEVNTPPMWAGGDDRRECVICYHSAGLLYKIHHCRNCGYYVCNNCSKKDWPASALPKSYVPEKETLVRVCDSCSYLQEGFVDSLRVGDVNLAMAFFSTGNVNLHSPMSIYKSEEYPLHAASQGGSIHLVRWLLEERKCSLRGVQGEVIKTSEGLTPLAIAAYFGHHELMTYFVRRHGCHVTEIKDFTVLIRGLHAALGAGGELPEGDNGNHGLFRSRRAVPGELETVEGSTDNASSNQSRAVPAQLATGNRTIGLVPSTTAEVAPTAAIAETTHRPKLAFGKRRAINPIALTQTRRSIENSSVFSDNSEDSEILSAVVRTRTPPRPSPGTIDPSRHMIVPYTDDDVIPFTEDLQLQYDAPILRSRSAHAGEAVSTNGRTATRNRSAPPRSVDDRYMAMPARVSRVATFDDDDVSVDTAMASHFDVEMERSYNRPSDQAVNEHVRSRMEAEEVEMRGVLSRANSVRMSQTTH